MDTNKLGRFEQARPQTHQRPSAALARELAVDVVVGAETVGVPLAASVAMAGELPFAFVRKPGYRGHEIGEPPVQGAEVAGPRAQV